MGLILSVFCSLSFCIERVLTWVCCAFVLVLLMSTVIIFMVYGVSVGYHYAQKELAIFAMIARTTTDKSTILRERPDVPVVRLLAVNRSDVESAQKPGEAYLTKKPEEQILYLETSETPIVVLETESPPKEPDFLPHERELARRLIGRFRRSRNNITSTVIPFLRPLRTSTETSPGFNISEPVSVHQ